MPQRAMLPFYTLLIAMVALIVATAALMTAKSSRQLALSSIEIEEGESLTLPVYNEEQSRMRYLILGELQVNNAGGPAVTLERFGKVEEGAGFLLALKGQAIQSADLKPHLFMLEQPLAAYQENPRLLKELWDRDLDSAAALNLRLEPGAGKSIRYGILLIPYGDGGELLAEMALVSLRLDFDNGRSHIFRRGYPIPPLAL